MSFASTPGAATVRVLPATTVNASFAATGVAVTVIVTVTGADGLRPSDDSIGEAVRPGEAAIRGVGEAPFGWRGERAVRRVGHDRAWSVGESASVSFARTPGAGTFRTLPETTANVSLSATGAAVTAIETVAVEGRSDGAAA